MLRYIALFFILLSFCKFQTARSEQIWNTSFDISERGVWMDADGILESDLTDVDWKLDYSNCNFEKEGDYAKSVPTSGGRFEVLDSDGELIWISDWINISEYKNLSIGFLAKETGSGSATEKKYIHAFYQFRSGEEISFDEKEAEGNWGEIEFSQVIEKSDSVQLIIKMNSSYANDKVYIDNVEITGDKDIILEPSFIGDMVINSPVLSGDTIYCEFGVYTDDTILIKDEQYAIKASIDLHPIGNVLFVNGIYKLMFLAENPGIFELLLYCNEPLLSKTANVEVLDINDFLFYEDFESGLSEFWDINGWGISGAEHIGGDKSLKHDDDLETGVSECVFSEPAYNLNDGRYDFHCVIKNGNWDPSSSNSLYLAFEGSDLSANPNSLVFGVNFKGSDDLFSVWQQKGDEVSLLGQTGYNWDAESEVEIDLVRNNKGGWTVELSDNEGDAGFVSFDDTQLSVLENIKVGFKYTSTRSGKLWFDNFYGKRINKGPYLLEVKNSNDGLVLVFNEDIDPSAISLQHFNYRISNGEWQLFDSFEVLSENKILLRGDEISVEHYELKVEGLSDLEGGEMDAQIIIVENISEALFHDIVINEIMADPVPSVSLPEVEYIELFNRSNKFIELEDWVLKVGDMEVAFPSYLIQPKEYLLLMDNDELDQFSANISKVSFKSFPILKNGGAEIAIINKKGDIIDEVYYKSSWYKNSEKDNGGWSLERIDPDRFCGDYNNWVAAEIPIGGTPGGSNSVMGENTDTSAPEIVAVETKSYNEVVVYFAEPVDTSINLGDGIGIDKESNKLKRYIFEDEMQLRITFEHSFLENKKYQLNISGLTDQCGNAANKVSGTFSIIVLEPGQVVINEVLFNPYTGAGDFVELYNQSGLQLDLSKLYIATRDDSLMLKSVYPLSYKKKFWEKEDWVVVSKDTTSILDNYYVPDPEKLQIMERFPSYLDKEGRVVIVDDSLRVIDEFVYSEAMHSSYISIKDGVSLERVNSKEATQNADNWQSASSMVGYATPGYENSQARDKLENQIEIEVVPEVLTPNDDGIDDELHIEIKNVASNSLVNIYLFDAVGQLKYQLRNNELLGANNKIIWNGKDTSNVSFSRGPYIVMIEILLPDGTREVVKKSFYLAS